MKYLFDHQKDFLRRFNKAKAIFLFFDYDGTLTPIVKKPEWATLPKVNKRVIKKLIKKKWSSVVVVSGRALKDVKKLVGIKGITYAGNHGLELEGPKLKYLNKKALVLKKKLDLIHSQLVDELGGFSKVLIEHKGLTLSVHYRLVKSKRIVRKVFKTIDEITKKYVQQEKIRISHGKKVVEIKPNIGWNKGKIVLWLLKYFRGRISSKNYLAIYLGDDTTDEDAFKVLKTNGIGIFVGNPRKRSQAKFYLENTKQVTEFLETISQRGNG
ncbi:trehalose-phosphatase [Candidatus Omnitrophota bacterium]